MYGDQYTSPTIWWYMSKKNENMILLNISK